MFRFSIFPSIQSTSVVFSSILLFNVSSYILEIFFLLFSYCQFVFISPLSVWISTQILPLPSCGHFPHPLWDNFGSFIPISSPAFNQYRHVINWNLFLSSSSFHVYVVLTHKTRQACHLCYSYFQVHNLSKLVHSLPWFSMLQCIRYSGDCTEAIVQ